MSRNNPSYLIRREDAIRLFNKRIREFRRLDYERGIVASLFDEFVEIPVVEPNLVIAPEEIKRGDVIEIGEDIVVMHHDDYYDMFVNSELYKDSKAKIDAE